jgi:signal transduction histidine kinase
MSAGDGGTVRDETRLQERARAKEGAAQADRAQRRLQNLYEISKLLTRFESVDRTVPKILGLFTETVPVCIAILMLDEQGEYTRTRAVVWHSEGTSQARLQAAMAHAQTAYSYLRGFTVKLHLEAATGASPLSSRSTTPPPPDSGGNAGFVVLPLIVEQGRIFGALQVESAQPLDEADLMFVNAVVNQLAIALDRLANVAARQAEAAAGQAAAERRATDARHDEQTQRFLAETSALLFSSLEYARTLGAVIHSVVPFLADICFVDEVAEDGRSQRLDVALADPTKQHLVDRIRQFSPDPGGKSPLAEVIRSGKSFVLEEISSFETIAENQAQAELLRETGVHSMMSVALVARGRSLGALTFAAAESGRRYCARDLELAEEIGHRAALAIDNARLYEQAQRATRIRDDLLSVVSHDLKNPLNVILLNTELMTRTSAGDDRSRKPVGSIKRSAERMNRLLEDLLDTASIDAGKLSLERRSLDVTTFVENMIDTMRPLTATASLHLKSELPYNLPAIFADSGRLQQVFANLLGNAIKFTPAGGTITVRAVAAGDVVQFSVADTGSGIPEEDIPHLFERFWQAPPTARQGTGLGLSIVRGIVLTHGGRLWVDSQVGTGSTFSFTLPVARRGIDEPAEGAE